MPRQNATGHTGLLAAGSTWFSASYLYMLLAAGLTVAVLTLAGWEPHVVVSDSMQPTLAPGDLLLVDPDHTEVDAGQIVVFTDDVGRTITHRVVDVNDTGELVTRGDSNDVADRQTVDPASVVGQPRTLVPLVGMTAVWWWDGTWWWLAALAAGTAAALRAALPPATGGTGDQTPTVTT